MTAATPSPDHPTRRPPDAVLVLVLAALGMIGPFSIDTIFPAFAQLGTDLHTSEVALQQLISAYMLTFAVCSLFVGAISDAWGRRPVMLAGLAVYLAASIGSALAPSFEVLLAMRALQGAGATASQIIGRAMVPDFFAGERAQRTMSLIAVIFGVAPAIAPILGGVIVGAGSWRTVFWFLAAWATLLIVAVILLPEGLPPSERIAFSPRAVLGSLWSVARHPDGRLLALIGALHFAGSFLYISSAPIFMGTLMQRGAQDYWMLFVPLVGGMIAGSWLAGRLAHWPARRTIRLGYAIGTLGWIINLALSLLPSTQGLPWAVAALPLANFGMAIAFPVIQLTMLQTFPHARGSAASVQGFASMVVGAVNAGVLAPLLAQRLVTLASGSLALFLTAWMLWAFYLRTSGSRTARG